VPIAPEKTVGPSTILTFAGIELDTNTMEARLPADKILKTRSILSEFLCRRKATLKEVQSLIDLLNFACTVVPPGRAFLWRLIDLTKGVNAPFYRIRLTRSVKSDLGLWKSFLDDFNSRSFFLSDDWLPSNLLNLFTDAAAGHGFGAIFGNFWFYGPWPEEWKKTQHCGFRVFSNCPQCPLMGSCLAKSTHTILHGQRSIGRDHK
jgi:hypothetical protein